MLTRVAATPALRRVELGFMAFAFGEHSTWLAILVYALQRGGPREVGLVAVLQLIPGIVLAPFAAYAGDRFTPHRALALGYGAQCLSMAATAIAMTAAAPIAAYVAATCAATCITFTRPVMGSLLPTITHAPAELVAANVVASLIEQVGVFFGPLVAGALMAWRSPAVVFLVAGIALGAACVLAVGLDPVEMPDRANPIGAREVVADVFAGFATLHREPLLRTLVMLGAGAGFVKGIADVIFVTFASERLDGGSGLSGLLAGAYGLGAILGAAGSARMVGSGRTTRAFLVSVALASGALLAIAAVGVLGPSLAGFAAMGAGGTVMGLAAFVTIQRLAPSRVLARVFGVLEGLQMGAIALGSLAVTVFVTWASLGVALVVLGTLLLVSVLLGVDRLRRHHADVPPVDDAVVARLLADHILAPLSAPTVERLARSAMAADFDPGVTVVAKGDAGDRYYLILDGAAEVSIDGRVVNRLGAGDSFGEVALLRGVPRVASVRASGALRTIVVARDEFLEAVTGHPRSQRLASARIEGYDGA
jgi:MFS family permease